MARAQVTPHIRLRPIALPTEHGGWPLLLEPILLGLLVAPSVEGVLVGLAALGAFLTRHPLLLALGDWWRGRSYPRTGWAAGFAVGYSLLALPLLAHLLASGRAAYWPALLAAAPLASIQSAYDLRKRSRALLPELAGALALCMLTPAITLAGGWAIPQSFALGIVLGVVRAAPTVLYVRERLRRGRGKMVSPYASLLAHGVGLLLAAAGGALGLVPATATVAAFLLTLRAAYGLAPMHPPVRAALVGMQEVAFGLATVLLLVVGVWQ